MKRFFCLICLLMSSAVISAYAAELPDDILTIDEGKLFDGELSFVQGSDREPEKSDFEIVNYFLMSSGSGERWATVTLKNTSAGQRILAAEQLMAVFADGEKRQPLVMEHKFSQQEIATFTVTFGKSRFPILYLYTRK